MPIHRPSRIDRLVWRPALRHRGGVAFLTVRSWRAASRDADHAWFKAEKRSRQPELLWRAAEEVAGELTALLHPTGGWTVTCVAPGHSRDAEAWSTRLARHVAAHLDLPFTALFEPRPVAGSSHPRQNLALPPLRWACMPTGPTIVIDDVATSGWHIAEALERIRENGVTAFGASWIGGTIRTASADTPDPSADDRRPFGLPPLAHRISPWSTMEPTGPSCSGLSEDALVPLEQDGPGQATQR